MKFQTHPFRFSGLAAMALLLAFGCGGGGGGTSSGGGGGTTSLNLFATDNLVTGYDHVWVTLYKVELVGPSGTVVAFEDAAGRQVDLRSLRDDVGRRFRLLGKREIANGNYTALNVTLGESVSIFSTGAVTATTGTFEGSTAGKKVLNLNLGSGTTVGSRKDLIVDFDLANWNLDGSTVSATGGAYLRLVTDDSSVGNIDRHDRDDYNGSVASLSGTAPTQTFSLTTGLGTVTVVTDVNTVIYNNSGAASPVLANGQRVEVYGSFSTTQNALVASRIKIEDEDGGDDELLAKVNSFDASTNTLQVTVVRSQGFQPTSTALTVNYADTAKFFGRRGLALTVDTFEAQLAVDAFLELEGTLGESFVATKIKVEGGDDHSSNYDGGDHQGEAEAKGTATSVDATAGTFSLRAREWEGLNISLDGTVPVALAERVEYKLDGQPVDKAAAFAALVSAQFVKVEGTFDTSSGILTARQIKITTTGNGGGDDR